MSENLPRRSFLKTSLAASAATGALLSPSVLAGQQKEPSDTLRTALIGCGVRGQALIKSCVHIPGMRVVALCDIWEKYSLRKASAMLSGYGRAHTTHTDYRVLLDEEKDLDAVLIATPDCWHARQTLASLKAGLSVYCERPMALSLGDSREMVRTARATGKVLQVGYQRRSHPAYRHCVEKLLGEARLLGPLSAINGQSNHVAVSARGWPRRYALDAATLTEYGYGSMERFRNWRSYRDLGSGPLGEYGSEQIDTFNWFLSANPSRALTSGGTEHYDPATHQWPDVALTLLEYETPAGTVRAFQQTLETNGHWGSHEKFLGVQGSLLLSEPAGMAKVYKEPSVPDWDSWVKRGYLRLPGTKPRTAEGDALLEVTETVEPNAYIVPVELEAPSAKPHLENFFQAIRGNEELRCPSDAAFGSVVTVLKVDEALRTGGVVKFRPEEFLVEAERAPRAEEA